MTTALVPANNADINATLRALGLMEEEHVSNFNRAKINGTTFELGEDIYPSNQKTKAPAFLGRLLDIPIEYQGVYLTADEAKILNRPNIADRFCKSHFDPAIYPNQADPSGRQGKYAEDGTECHKCPINPYTKRSESPLEGGKKCSWRGDLVFQLCEEDGTTLDETVWTLSLPTTGMIELKGMRKEPEKGYVSSLNFMQQLSHFAIERFPDDNIAQAVTKAGTALRMGGVIAAFTIIQTKSADGSRNFPVVVLTPRNIVDTLDNPVNQIEAGTTEPTARSEEPTPAEAKPATADDDLPF